MDFKGPAVFENPALTLIKKASFSLKSSKIIEIFKKATLKIFLKCHKFLKKPRGNCRIAKKASPPLHEIN
jgi:hypothetical protein